MKFLHVTTGPLRVNTYILINEELSTAIVIDSGENYNRLKKIEQEYNFKIKAVLLTHAHFDHAGNARALQRDGAKIYISEVDAQKLLNDDNLGRRFGRNFEYLQADYLLNDGDIINVEGIEIKVISTPGHTDGSVCFLIGNMLFSGDTLFLESVGRTDFVSGNRNQLVESVRKLFNLPGEYNVYPGHEEFTTLSHERKYNTFIDYD